MFRKSILIMVLLSTVSTIWAQGKRYYIKGTFDHKPSINSITIDSNTVTVSNNEFELYGYTTKSELAYITTNRFAKDSFWLMPGNYEMKLYSYTEKEKPYLKIQKLQQAPSQALDYFRLKTIKDSLQFKTPRLSEETIQLEFTNALYSYATKTKGNEVLQYFNSQLPKSKITDSYFNKLEKLLGADKNNTQQRQQDLLQKGRKLENFSMPTMNDSSVALYNVKAKIILLDFWASWCGPCRRKHPLFANLYSKYKNHGFEIVSISLDDKKINWTNAVVKDKMDWINLSELKLWNNSLAKKYGINRLPFNILLNSNYEVITVDASVGVIEAFCKQAKVEY